MFGKEGGFWGDFLGGGCVCCLIGKLIFMEGYLVSIY